MANPPTIYKKTLTKKVARKEAALPSKAISEMQRSIQSALSSSPPPRPRKAKTSTSRAKKPS